MWATVRKDNEKYQVKKSFGSSSSGGLKREIYSVYLSVRCPMLLCMAPTCFHSPSVCCVWVSGSPAAMTVLSEWSNTPTLWFPQHPAKTDWRPSEAFWTESQLQLACSVTVYTITPFKICQLRCAACQNPSDCCSAVSTFPHNILYL